MTPAPAGMVRRSAWLALVSTTVVMAGARSAAAHGGIPRAFSISFAPDDPKQILLRSDVWGIMRSKDDGQSWQWSCAETYGDNSLAADHRPMLLGNRGRILVASQFYGLQLTDDFCNWRSSPVFTKNLVVEDIDLSPSSTDAPAIDSGVQDTSGRDGGRRADAGAAGPELLVLTTSNVGAEDGGSSISGILWRSTDNGDHFTHVGKAPPDDLLRNVRATGTVEPAADLRCPAARSRSRPTAAVERSDDNGATWHDYLFPIPPDQQATTQRLVLVDPTRPDIALVWIDQTELLGQTLPDSILATTDAGVTWTTIYRGTGDLPGLALSPDHKTLLIAGPFEGVESAKPRRRARARASGVHEGVLGRRLGLELGRRRNPQRSTLRGQRQLHSARDPRVHARSVARRRSLFRSADDHL